MAEPPRQADAPVEGEGDTELAALVERIRSGDREAARSLYDRYRDAVMGYCVLAADGDEDLAEDYTQEAFMEVFQSLENLDDPERFNGWFWTIVRRTCADHQAQRSRHVEILDLFAVNRDVVFGHEDKAARERRIACVHDILEEIDDDKLAAIVERKYTEPEYTTREIAEELDIPHGTVTVKLMRFREAVADELEEKLESIDWAHPSLGESP